MLNGEVVNQSCDPSNFLLIVTFTIVDITHYRYYDTIGWYFQKQERSDWSQSWVMRHPNQRLWMENDAR